MYRWAPDNRTRARTEPAPSDLLKATGIRPYNEKSSDPPRMTPRPRHALPQGGGTGPEACVIGSRSVVGDEVAGLLSKRGDERRDEPTRPCLNLSKNSQPGSHHRFLPNDAPDPRATPELTGVYVLFMLGV